KRTGRDRFVRNVLIAIGNSGDAALAPAAERLLSDASPLVRGAAVWALTRLDPARASALASLHAGEGDPAVAGEWVFAANVRYPRPICRVSVPRDSWEDAMTAITRRSVVAGLAATAALHPDRALAAWPERNISMLHGLTAGGGVDVSARLIADGLTR